MAIMIYMMKFYHLTKNRFTIMAIICSLICISSMFSPSILRVNAEEDDDTPFIYGSYQTPESLDPLSINPRSWGSIIVNCFEGLYAPDYTSDYGNAYIPRIASDFGTWNDAKTELTIPLRTDVKWWDGTILTADDVVWNFNRINTMARTGGSAHYWLWREPNELGGASNKIVLVSAVDEHTVKFTLSKYYPEWEYLLAFSGASLIKPITEGESNKVFTMNEYKQLIGTGPFKFESLSQTELTLTRWDDYYDGAADISKIKVKFYGDLEDLSEDFMEPGSEMHLAQSISNEAFNQILSSSSDKQAGKLYLPQTCQLFLRVDTIPVEVRKAIQYGYNYSYWSSFSSFYEEQKHPIPIGMEGYNPDLPGLPEMNRTKARAFLLSSENSTIQSRISYHGLTESSTDEDWITAAKSDTPIVKIEFAHYGQNIYQILKENMEFIGINLTQRVFPSFEDYVLYVSDPHNPVQVSINYWTPGFYDPMDIFEPLFSPGEKQNWANLNNDSVNANIPLLEEYAVGSTDRANVIDDLVTEIIVEQAAAMWVGNYADLMAWDSNEITGIASGIETLFNGKNDKFFYLIDFGPSTIPEDKPSIPGFPILALAVISMVTLFTIKSKK